MILLKTGKSVRHTWVSGDLQMREAGIIRECGFTNWFYFLAVFKEVFKITYWIKKHPSKKKNRTIRLRLLLMVCIYDRPGNTLANIGVTFQKWVKCCRAKRTCICTCTVFPQRESDSTPGGSGPSKAGSLIQRLREAPSTQEAPPPPPAPLPPPLVPKPHPLGLRLFSVLVKNKCLQEEVNTFLFSVIYTLVWRSQQHFLSWDGDLKGGQGENEAVWWGHRGAELMGGRWVAETEGEAEALKTDSASL